WYAQLVEDLIDRGHIKEARVQIAGMPQDAVWHLADGLAKLGDTDAITVALSAPDPESRLKALYRVSMDAREAGRGELSDAALDQASTLLPLLTNSEARSLWTEN